jgi:hypothetical protein
LAFDGRVEKRDKPGKFTVKEVLEHLEKVKDVRPGKTDITGKKGSGATVQRFIAANLGCGDCHIGNI